MTDQELRALVREAVARQLGRAASGSQVPAPAMLAQQHCSHGLFVLSAGIDVDGPCLIEPTVPCNHCGYCKSMGH